MNAINEDINTTIFKGTELNVPALAID